MSGSPQLALVSLKSPSRFARMVSRLASHRVGRVAVSACGAGLSGALAFAAARQLGMDVTGAWISTGATILIFFPYLLVFLNMRVLSYFPRPAERFVDGATPIAVAVLIGWTWLMTAPMTVVNAIALLVIVGIAIRFGVSRKRRGEQLRYGVTYARTSADARVMLALARFVQRGPLNPRERFLVRLNTAHALIMLAESEDTYRHLHEAYDIVYELASGPQLPEPGVRVVLAEALTETASTLHRLGDDLQVYEEAARLLDHELQQSPPVPNAAFRRLLNQADLQFNRSGIPALLVTPEPARTQALRDAIGYLREALPVAPAHRRAELHFRLAVEQSILADWTDSQDLLSEAILNARAALQAIRYVTRHLRPEVQLVLADLLTQRFSHASDRVEDLSEAERLATAIRRSSNPEPRAMAWSVLIRTLRLRSAFDGRPPDIRTYATAAYREAMAPMPFSRARLQLAALFGRWAADEDQPDGAAWGYREALETARRLSATGLIRRQQQAPLYHVRGLAAEATHWLLEAGRVHDAVVTLESSRALVLTAAINRETLIRRLERHDPNLARRCAEVSGQLSRADRTFAEAGSPRLWASVGERRAARAVHDEWHRLANSLRRWPEFHALLTPPDYAHVAAALRQPLVYLAAAENTGHALIVEPGTARPGVVRLPELTTARVSHLAGRFRADYSRLADPVHARTHWRATLDDCLTWLQDVVMEPLVQQQRLTGSVTLVPIGDLTLLPLHAAGHADARVSKVVWSYAPSARVLVHAGRTALDRRIGPANRILFVDAPGVGAAELRYAHIMDSALHRGQRSVTRLSDGAGTRDAVLRALGVHDIYHFACHGAANNADPLESYLQLADGRITVRDLLNQRLRGRLAVLAACESSVPYAQLPDEMVGLPATLLEAGVPGVVGTLWPVEELPTTLLMARFYELLLDRRIEPAAALHQAQSWLRTGTAGQFEAYLNSTAAGRSAWPYRHTGDAREDRFFAHPDCWAAFTYIGH